MPYASKEKERERKLRRSADPERHAQALATMRAWRQKNHDAFYLKRRLAVYKLTTDAWNVLYEVQNGRCKICLRSLPIKRLDIDHNHVSGKVRGLLCHKCNLGIGMFCESPSVIEAALAYLKEHSA